MRVGELGADGARQRIAGQGMALRIPPITVRVRSRLPHFAAQLSSLYRDYELTDASAFADIDVRMVREGSLRRPLVQFIVDGTTPFDAFPAEQALPMFEWGLNWVFAHRMHMYLLLHAGVVERDGRALVLPAWPGSGKSTLAAALACQGYRFLSDEFGVVTLSGQHVLPFARPAALKNESIDVIRAMAPAALGGAFVGTRKGTVAHLRVPLDSVLRGSEPAQIAAIVFPDFRRGAPVSIQPLAATSAFLKLAGNAFNYEVVGEMGFGAVTSIVRRCPVRMLQYGDLDGAFAALDALMAEVAPA